ncbi:Asp23/Gls24 family envelope stress response protein, partial [Salmonella enterica]|uniref:Asp23/Gls24 family envelope stress response protein n=1 Tax=Salmonella enterica TaxID=28901 RepID=UPI0032996266
GILNSKKNYTKGVRVEVGNEEAAIDLIINVLYGSKIQKVCSEVQNEVKKAVETMTGLRVVEVNVSVQAITFENR